MNMRILWVKVGGLWPATVGGRLRSLHTLSALAHRHHAKNRATAEGRVARHRQSAAVGEPHPARRHMVSLLRKHRANGVKGNAPRGHIHAALVHIHAHGFGSGHRCSPASRAFVCSAYAALRAASGSSRQLFTK